MIEQKLFFTRNGEYRLWEKIDSLNDVELESLIELIRNKFNEKIEETSEPSRKKGIIFSIYKSNEEYSKVLDKEINSLFSEEKANKCDFNATLYKVNVTNINIDTAYINLQKLSDINDEEYQIENIDTKVFLRKENNCIDIRISSNRLNNYKDNSNEQIINTEVRVYFDLGILVMTDYNEYTHSKKIKDILLKHIYSLIKDSYSNRSVCKLSDITLRLLLRKCKKYANKFKFNYNDYANVDFNIMEDLGSNPLEHTGLKEFYDEHPISLIKIAMNSNDDKYITVDGARGKLISRSKTMQVKDIDEFIKLLSYVIRFDYLNFDYKNELRSLANKSEIGPTPIINSYVNDTYLEVEKNISRCLGDKNELDTMYLIRNTFFYCLINNKIVNNIESESENLDSKLIKKLSKWLNIRGETVSAVFNSLIGIAIDQDDSMLLEAFDDYINEKGDLNVNQV